MNLCFAEFFLPDNYFLILNKFVIHLKSCIFNNLIKLIILKIVRQIFSDSNITTVNTILTYDF